MFHVEHPHAAAIGAGRPTPHRSTTTRTGLQDCDSDRKRRRSRDRRVPGHPQRHVPRGTPARRGPAGAGHPTPDRWTARRTALQGCATPTSNGVEAATLNCLATRAMFHVEHPHAGGTGTGDRGIRRPPLADGAQRAAIETLAALRHGPPAVAADVGAGGTGHSTNPPGAGAALRPRLLAIR